MAPGKATIIKKPVNAKKYPAGAKPKAQKAKAEALQKKQKHTLDEDEEPDERTKQVLEAEGGEGVYRTASGVLKNRFGTVEWTIELQQFNVEREMNDFPDAFVGFYGKRRTGKTTCLIHILNKMSHHFPAGGIVISATEKFNHKFANHFHQQMIFDGWDDKIGTMVFERQMAVPKEHPYYRQVAVIDDMAADKETHNNDMLNKFAMNGRHVGIMVCITTQYPTGVNPKVRSNADFAFIFTERNINARRHLWESYGSGLDFNHFCAMLDKYTDGEKHMCIVVCNAKNKNELLSNFFWFVAKEEKPGNPYFDLVQNRKSQPKGTLDRYLANASERYLYSPNVGTEMPQALQKARLVQTGDIGSNLYHSLINDNLF